MLVVVVVVVVIVIVIVKVVLVVLVGIVVVLIVVAVLVVVVIILVIVVVVVVVVALAAVIVVVVLILLATRSSSPISGSTDSSALSLRCSVNSAMATDTKYSATAAQTQRVNRGSGEMHAELPCHCSPNPESRPDSRGETITTMPSAQP